MKHQVRWKNSSPFCWQYSVDAGETWHNLRADDENDSSQAIDEAAKLTGVATSLWDLIES